VYELFGTTLMVWVHWASATLDGVPANACVPVCTGAETVAAVPASQVQPASPDSKPGSETRLVAAVAGGVASRAEVSRAAMAAARTAAVPRRVRDRDGMCSLQRRRWSTTTKVD
jgi:hypothetical protein